MLDSGGGGGYSGTDWNGYDVRQMWSMVEGQETDSHWKLVSGWRKTAELASIHMSRLKNYRDQLAEAWPPEKNAAAAAYVTHLDYLITHVEQTYEAAVANQTAFSGATGALSGARTELKKLFDEYQANQAKLDDYAVQLAAAKDPASSGLPQPALGPPPVPNGRQEQLTYQARSIMFSLSGEISQARVAIRQPPPYRPPGSGQDGDGDPTTVGPPIAVPPPPVIPPVVTTPAPSPTSTPGNAQFVAQTGGGPTLVGGTNVLVPSNTVNPIVQPPVSTVATPPPSTGVIGPPLAPSVSPTTRPSTGVIGTPAPSPKAGVQAPPPPRAMPPGGVIGPVNPPVAGQPGGGRPATPRVNPVGGVIGQPGPGGIAGGQPRPLGAGGAGAAPGTSARPVPGVHPTPGARPASPHPGGTVPASGTRPVPPGAGGRSTSSTGTGGRSTSPNGAVGASSNGVRLSSAGTTGVGPTGATSQPLSRGNRQPAHRRQEPHGSTSNPATTGQTGSGTAGTTSGQAGAVSGMTAAGGRSRPEQRPERPSAWDSDNPWETGTGVDPVVLPPAPPKAVDPGPAIGHHR